MTGYTPGMSATRPLPAVRRQARERKIIDAARALFDERGMQEARIDRIARRVGINKALIYRHFASKEELFALTTTTYLDEIAELLHGVDQDGGPPRDRLRRGFAAFADYGIAHPAFLDCALSLLRQPAGELRGEVSEAVWLRLGQATGACVGQLADVLAELEVAEPELRANQLYLQAIGVLHLARSGVGVRRSGPGTAESFAVGAEQVRGACVELALAAAGPGAEA
jgi:AcrR family transcriptional regulator